MIGIDKSITFLAINIAVMTVSDSRIEESDRSGAVLVDRLTAAGHNLAEKVIVPDEFDIIVTKLNIYNLKTKALNFWFQAKHI